MAGIHAEYRNDNQVTRNNLTNLPKAIVLNSPNYFFYIWHIEISKNFLKP